MDLVGAGLDYAGFGVSLNDGLLADKFGILVFDGVSMGIFCGLVFYWAVLRLLCRNFFIFPCGS